MVVGYVFLLIYHPDHTHAHHGKVGSIHFQEISKKFPRKKVTEFGTRGRRGGGGGWRQRDAKGKESAEGII